MGQKSTSLSSVLVLAALLSAPTAAAQESTAHAGLSLELNRLEQNGPACRATLILSLIHI